MKKNKSRKTIELESCLVAQYIKYYASLSEEERKAEIKRMLKEDEKPYEE